jgi:nitrogenase-associated protein
MTHILFWEKPGCGGNAKQKAWLQSAGHTLEVRDLLSWPWTREALLEFLAPLPVTKWFNRAAPRIKSGEVIPEALDAETALQTLLTEPLLIRRPLMQVGDERRVGFDPAAVDTWIGLSESDAARPAKQAEGCAANMGSSSCTPT